MCRERERERSSVCKCVWYSLCFFTLSLSLLLHTQLLLTYSLSTLLQQTRSRSHYPPSSLTHSQHALVGTVHFTLNRIYMHKPLSSYYPWNVKTNLPCLCDASKGVVVIFNEISERMLYYSTSPHTHACKNIKCPYILLPLPLPPTPLMTNN